MRRALSVAIAACSLSVGCAHTGSHEGQRQATAAAQPVPALNELLNKRIDSLEDEVARKAKEGGQLDAVRQVGLATGIHRGRHWRQRQLNEWIIERKKILAQTYNFEQVLIDGVYLPPRVEQVKDRVEKTKAGDLRFIHQAYRIASDPELVVEPPTFLNYLYQAPDPIEPPNAYGLPEKGTRQVQVWQNAVLKGWQIGVDQANSEFKADLNLLVRDYKGMLRYLQLVYKGMIRLPSVETDDRGVVISSDGRRLNLGDEIVSIDRAPAFQHSAKWDVLEDGLGGQDGRQGGEQ